MDSEIRIIIVEDMADYVDVIEMLLKEIAPWVKIVGKATSLSEAEQLIEAISPDAILLDIQFENEGKTGFDLIDSLRRRMKLNFQIIIITAHYEKQYYAKAFEYKALHFLEKPINKYKLADAMVRVKDSLLVGKIDALASIVENEIGILKSIPQSPKINIQGLRFNEIVDVNNIIWIEADGRMTNIYLQNEKKLTSLNNIGIIETQLLPYTNFFRINRSEILNLNFVERFSKKEKLIVISGECPHHFASKDKILKFSEAMGEKQFRSSVIK